jgi:hypothetical protein
MYGQWPPIDRFTGQPACYLLVDGKPRLYSTGVDRDDDGGRSHRMGNHFGERWVPWSKVNRPHVPSRNSPLRRYAMGPKFDWDWVLWSSE